MEWFLTHPNVAVLANWLGILGFLLTLYVAWRVRRIGRAFKFVARLRNYKRDLGKYGDNINLLLAGEKIDTHNAAQELLLCSTVLKALKSQAVPDIAAGAKPILRSIQKVVNKPHERITKDSLEAIQRDLRALEESLSHWSGPRKSDIAEW